MDWTWLKRFRVWGANRKVFLFPENYIEPDLRDDREPQPEPRSRVRHRRRTKPDADE